MNPHKRIIGILWIATALILAVLLLLTFYNASHGHALSTSSIAAASLLITAQLAAGYTLLANLRWSHWLNLPLSVASLFNLPLGTLIGGYYLWYYLKHEWKRSEAPPAD